MESFGKTGILRVVAILLAVSLLVPCYASAAVEQVQPRASDYIDVYDAYISTMNGGALEIGFEITATAFMDELGAESIRLYESSDQTTWKRVMTCLYEDWPSMVGNNNCCYSSHMDYQGVSGKYYKAYIKLWAGRDGAGDYVFVWTPIVRAT